MGYRDVEVLRIRLMSSSDPSKNYMIEVKKDPDSVVCNCEGFAYRSRCKHIKFYKQLITKFLHDTPSF